MVIPHCDFTSSHPGQNGHHFANNIFRCIFVNESSVFWFKFHWSLFPRNQLKITTGLDNGLVPNSLYLNQCWPDSLTHICVTSGRWVIIHLTIMQCTSYISLFCLHTLVVVWFRILFITALIKFRSSVFLHFWMCDPLVCWECHFAFWILA